MYISEIKDWNDVASFLIENIWHEVFVYNTDEAYEFLEFAYNNFAFRNIEIDKERIEASISNIHSDPLLIGFWVGESSRELQVIAHNEEELETEQRLKGIRYHQLVQKFNVKIEVDPDEFVNLLSM